MSIESLTLTRLSQTVNTIYGLTGFRFQVTASNAVGTLIKNEIFLYTQLPLDPANSSGTQNNYFVGICSPSDLVELPINNSLPDILPANFRSASLDIICRSESEANSTWIQLQVDVQALLNSLAFMDVLTNQQIVNLGNQ
jgi:hypothetical protein